MARTKLDLSQIAGVGGNDTLEQNIAKIEENNYRVIVFVIADLVKEGVQKAEIRFPFQGTLEGVYASCGSSGSTNTVVEIQKCSQDYIDGVDETGEWANVLSQNLTIEAAKRSSNTSTAPAVIATPEVNLYDHFRLNITTAGGLRDLTVEVKIKI